MVTKEITLLNASGLHARPASDFVNKASTFSSKITIRRVGEAEASNAKSIMMVLSAGFSHGHTVEISAQGADEEEAVSALAALIEGGFGELSEKAEEGENTQNG